MRGDFEAQIASLRSETEHGEANRQGPIRAARVSISSGFGPPGTPQNRRKIPVFGRPKIDKNLTFWLSDPTFKPGIGTGMAGNPPYLILRSGG